MHLLRLITAAIVLTPSTVQAADPVPACVWIRSENDSAGAGFLIDAKKKWVVTCRHVVAERDRVDVYFPWIRDGALVSEKATYLGNRDTLRRLGLLQSGRVLKKSDAADLALVELDALPASVTPLSLAAVPVQPGDPLRVLGCRIDLETVFNLTSGSARQTGRLTEGYFWRGRKLAANADAILGQLPIEEGDSGGPVLNARSEVVGMASALRRGTPSAAVAISAAEIRKFLLLAEPKPEPTGSGIGETLTRATVWIRPQAADVHLAGVVIDRFHILTSARGLGDFEIVGVAFPLREKGAWIGEREPYRDAVGLRLKGHWKRGIVIARDPARDLALIRTDEGIPADSRAVQIATTLPARGDPIHAMSHPGGLEFAWVYAAGSIRQRGRLALATGEKPPNVDVHLLQLPAQIGSPGGPVLNPRGELIGVLAARESNQQTGYAATSEEIARFLDVAFTDRPPRSFAALLARIEAMHSQVAAAIAMNLTICALEQPVESREWFLRLALSLDPTCSIARSGLWHLLLKSGRTAEAEAELDRAVARDPVNASWLSVRAVRRSMKADWRGARGDLERVLDVYPERASDRKLLVRVLLELNKDDEALAAVRDAVRTAPNGIAFLASDLLAQSDRLARKFPDAPAISANWLNRAIGAAHKSEPDPARRAECEVVLKAAAGAADDAVRLRLLRDFLTKLDR